MKTANGLYEILARIAATLEEMNHNIEETAWPAHEKPLTSIPQGE